MGKAGGVRSPMREGIGWINEQRGGRVVSVDVPSGLMADTGEVGGEKGVAVRADVTVTFLAAKPGFDRNAGPEHVGRVVVADLGVRLASLLDAAGVS